MRIALITTTIYVPTVLEHYRRLDSGVAMFVAGDRQTPHVAARSFIESLGNATYYSDADQEKLGYKSSAVIGWNKIMRRNIALLEALRWEQISSSQWMMTTFLWSQTISKDLETFFPLRTTA